jgi:hypothetical protein
MKRQTSALNSAVRNYSRVVGNPSLRGYERVVSTRTRSQSEHVLIEITAANVL